MNNRYDILAIATCLILASLPCTLAQQAYTPSTYRFEGTLMGVNQPITDQCQFRVELWETRDNTGARIGNVQVYPVRLLEGRFSLLLNERGQIGPDVFRGGGYWMELAIKCTAEADFVRFPERHWVGAQAATYSIDWWTLDGGGGTSTGGSLELTGSIGQPDTGSSSGGSYSHAGGFWAASSGYRLYLPLIRKS